jgi:hypothetical protein
MSFAPDYGLRRMRDGATGDLDIYLYDVLLDGIDVLERGQFSTMVEVPYQGEAHALSLDFGQKHLDDILAMGSVELQQFVLSELSRDPDSSREIEFEEDVVCGVRARLGTVQEAEDERFVPLVVQEIF